MLLKHSAADGHGSFSREGQAILCDAMWFFYT